MFKTESENNVNDFIGVSQHMVHMCISKKDYKIDCNDQED